MRVLVKGREGLGVAKKLTAASANGVGGQKLPRPVLRAAFAENVGATSPPQGWPKAHCPWRMQLAGESRKRLMQGSYW